MSYGFTPTGFNIKRFDDIVTDMRNALIEQFGNVDTDDASVFGQFAAVSSKPPTDIWELLGYMYSMLNPDTAENVYLDDVAAINGIKRLPETSTTVVVGLNGTTGTIVPKGTILNAPLTLKQFSTDYETTISSSSKNLLYITLESLQASQVYSFNITVNSVTTLITTTSASTPITDTIMNSLTSQLNALGNVTATYLTNGRLKIAYSSGLFDVSIVSTTRLGYYNVVDCSCTEYGPISASIYTISGITTPVSGLSKVLNFEDGLRGRYVESDVDFRLRRKQSLQILGKGTVAAIVSRIQNNVSGVSLVAGFENHEDSVVDGRPAHSIEIVVAGGTAEDIATEIWNSKSGGIQTHSSNTPKNSFDVIDSNNDPQTIYFSRPITMYTWVRITATKYSEELFPVDGVDQIKANILAYGNTFGLGVNVIPVRFIPPVLLVAGIQTVVVEVFCSTNSGDTPVYVTTPISILSTQFASFDLTRIFVTVT